MSAWYLPMRSWRSKGSKKIEIRHISDLAKARAMHHGQFFTPDDLVHWIWSYLTNLDITSVFDNSIGSGRLVQLCDPQKHFILGCDTDPLVLDALRTCLNNGGFRYDIKHESMANISGTGIDLAIINPPYSVHLESPAMKNYPCTTYGKFGANTAAQSDYYAVYQALNVASVVVAILPAKVAEHLSRKGAASLRDRLRAVVTLPVDTFSQEGANIKTAVCFFSGTCDEAGDIKRWSLTSSSEEPKELGLRLEKNPDYLRPHIYRSRVGKVRPLEVDVPVTGNRLVTVALDGRRIKLKFACGYTQARVLNCIMKYRVYSTEVKRYTSNVQYAGQGRLDLEAYLASDDPVAAFSDFLDFMEKAGAKVDLRPGVLETVRKKARAVNRAKVGFSRVVWGLDCKQSSLELTAKEDFLLNPKSWSSPIIEAGTTVPAEMLDESTVRIHWKEKDWQFPLADLKSGFSIPESSTGWTKIEKGKFSSSKQHETLLRKRAKTMGIDQWLSWDYQLDDCVETIMQPRYAGTLIGWEQACGKSRLAQALAFLSQAKHVLIIVESRLVQEMLIQLKVTGGAPETIHVIERETDIDTLQHINIVSYERLRTPVDPSRPKMTYAKRLRRRFGLVIADEAEKLGNRNSEQSKAVFMLSPKRRVLLSGTPIANYARDMHGLMLFLGGDATAIQPYGLRRMFMDESQLRSIESVSKGIDQLVTDFVKLEWSTNQFTDTLQEGAKREIPLIKDVHKFREWLAPFIKRRLTSEPEVAKFIQLPPLFQSVTELDWDYLHLCYYVTVAEEFANWYKAERESGKGINLQLLLARITAVLQALNNPQSNGMYTGGLTSKQQHAIDRLEEIAMDGKKALLFCNSPDVVTLLARELEKRDVSCIEFSGKHSIRKRNYEKDQLFKAGKASHMLATYGTAKSGQNLPQADYVIFYDRTWSFRTQDQAMKRPRRVERREPLYAEFYHLPGSLDEYQHQLISFKADAANAGLDWGTPQLDDAKFYHMDHMLNDFIKGLADMRAMTLWDYKNSLKLA
ncbi:SNF2-related protein [Flavobacterium sp.]|uniref:SNF2-related protein n=1 Tax=Flavobacterium sp. TaxID=239 RepID=UPI002625ABA0|nr:SNF2-related protein [Flavobacterium sp.]